MARQGGIQGGQGGRGDDEDHSLSSVSMRQEDSACGKEWRMRLVEGRVKV